MSLFVDRLWLFLKSLVVRVRLLVSSAHPLLSLPQSSHNYPTQQQDIGSSLSLSTDLFESVACARCLRPSSSDELATRCTFSFAYTLARATNWTFGCTSTNQSRTNA